MHHANTDRRYVELDALRGVAALAVVAHHLRLATHAWQLSWALVPLFAGDQAVDLFFVLSGFVLSLPYWRGQPLPYATYLVRRMIRIYLPFLAAFALSLVGAAAFAHRPLPPTPFFAGVWQNAFNPGLLLQGLLLWPMHTYNSSFWSLRYEIQLSIAMPVLLWLLKRARWATLAMALLVSFASAGLPARLDQVHLLGKTLQVAALFVMGALLAREEPRLRSYTERLGNGLWLVLLIALFLYFGYPCRMPLGRLHGWLSDRHMLVSATGAAGLILCALHLQPFRALLRSAPLRHLGGISYSLYLVHGTVLTAAFGVLYGRVPELQLDALAMAGSLAAAVVFHRCVERPTIQLGRHCVVARPQADWTQPGEAANVAEAVATG